MERLFKEQPTKKIVGAINNRPTCERCGRTVRISSDDYMRDEILCTHCAAEAELPEVEDTESLEV